MSEPRQTFRYKKLADEIESRIHSGVYQPGEKLPSIRQLHSQMNLSISTIHQAYIELETTGLIEARPKSGYYVSPISLNRLKPPEFDKIPAAPQKVALGAMVNSVLAAINNPRMLPLGSSSVSSELLPCRHFTRMLKTVSVQEMKGLLSYSLTEGNPELRRQIALRTMGLPKGIGPADIVITNGCTEAVTLCLQAILRPGDTLAIETPTHFGFLQLLRSLGLMVVEVPTHPRHGVDIGELEKILKKTPVRACLFMPNFQNPLGALMPDEKKEELVNLLNRLEIPVIEDDICGEMYYEEKQRPSLLKHFDRKDLVLTCSSFSKILAPGLRIGWAIPGKRFKDEILRHKAGTTVATSTLDQALIARFLSEGAYDRHLRTLRQAIKSQTFKTAWAILKHFPADTRLALPRGGSLLWVRLDRGISSLDIYEKALAHHISILPGTVCSVSGQFGNYIRIGCGHPFTDETEKGIETLGALIDECLHKEVSQGAASVLS
ncbi:PLP-dependent aminotransferase family protein [Desulfonema ishimotonii]|uniref:PLP-dependent aminotransferase family protein n=1 Tax=Desulfonema ishimotonii TaxID=45657 RepID=A0A401FTL4_9BACT|nr:PLP-dependent aminotransferase family protein [Desulfonema ishimotonii]GBC60327.1 PLP-dependent aminotransferase family protein [Desulfonema ishimotonii]